MKKHTPKVIIVLFLSLSTPTVFAHEGATGIVKQRMDAMSEMGDAMKAMGDMVKGKTAFEWDSVRQAVDQLRTHSAEVPLHFPDTPESKNFHMTEALPEVWKSKDRFDQLFDELQTRINALKDLADNNVESVEFRKAFIKVTKSCSACHDDFRKPKD